MLTKIDFSEAQQMLVENLHQQCPKHYTALSFAVLLAIDTE